MTIVRRRRATVEPFPRRDLGPARAGLRYKITSADVWSAYRATLDLAGGNGKRESSGPGRATATRFVIAIVHADAPPPRTGLPPTNSGTFGGWGMRISFVPDDQVYEEPVVEVREPDPKR
jgi:hypothetical protein